MEELGRVLAPGPFAETYMLAALLLSMAGAPGRRLAMLPGIVDGSMRATLCYGDGAAATASISDEGSRSLLSGRHLVSVACGRD